MAQRSTVFKSCHGVLVSTEILTDLKLLFLLCLPNYTWSWRSVQIDIWGLLFGHQAAIYPLSVSTFQGHRPLVQMRTACQEAPLSSLIPCHIAEDLSFVTKHKCPENAPRIQAHLRRRYSGAQRWLYLLLITTLVDPLAHPANSHRGRIHTKPRFWILLQALLDHDAVCLVCTCVVS